MIKKERGVVTELAYRINNISREDAIGGMHVVQDLEEKVGQLEINRENEKTNDENGMER